MEARRVRLGHTDIALPRFCIGTWQWGSRSWGYGSEYSREELRRAFMKAIDYGLNCFDTAEVYGLGASEKLLGEFSRDYGEDEVLIASKVWATHAWASGIRWAAKRSLRRLGRKTIDLYQVHWYNPLIPVSSSARGMLELQRENIIRAVGVSNYNTGQMLRFYEAAGGRLDSNQVRYSLLSWRSVEEKLLPAASERNITVLAYSPLDQGAVLGRYSSSRLPRDLVRRFNPLFTRPAMRALEELVGTVTSIAEGRGVSPAAVVLSFLSSRGTVPIVGVRREEHVESLREALELKLSREECEQILRARGEILIPKSSYLHVLARIVGLE